jgi:hypothetical protein
MGRKEFARSEHRQSELNLLQLGINAQLVRSLTVIQNAMRCLTSIQERGEESI